MKVIVILTAMLWYEGIGTTAQTDFTRAQFKTIYASNVDHETNIAASFTTL